MQVTVEISLYPLNSHFGPVILDFIQNLRSHKELKIKTNSMSTQMTGPFDTVMDVLKTELASAFKSDNKVAVVIKMFSEDLELEWLEK